MSTSESKEVISKQDPITRVLLSIISVYNNSIDGTKDYPDDDFLHIVKYNELYCLVLEGDQTQYFEINKEFVLFMNRLSPSIVVSKCDFIHSPLKKLYLRRDDDNLIFCDYSVNKEKNCINAIYPIPFNTMDNKSLALFIESSKTD